MHLSTIVYSCGCKCIIAMPHNKRPWVRRRGPCPDCRSLGRENMLGGRIKDCPPLSASAFRDRQARDGVMK